MSKRARQSSASATPAASLAERASEALRLERFKDAIELLKQLIKEDVRPEWRHALAEAYVGRARALAAKGMFKEAEIVLGNTAAPDGIVRESLLYLQCLIRQGQPQKAAAYAAKWIGTTSALPAETSGLAELAGALLLAFPVRLDAPPGAAPERARPIDMVAAARQALDAWIEKKPAEEIEPLLGRIPLRSPFRAVRLILKSLITAPHDRDRARQLLDTIPAGSPFAAFREAVELVLAKETELLDRMSRSSAAEQSFAAEVSGLPAAASQVLAQLVEAERAGPGALFSFLMKRTAPLPLADVRAACLNLLPRLPERLSQFEKTFGPLSAVERSRIHALAAEAGSDWGRAERHWRMAASGLELDHEKTAKLSAAVIYRHLADLARTSPEIEGERQFESPVIFYLERSLDADPDHLPAVLQLVGLYRVEGPDKKWHELADSAARRFPDSGAALLQAVDSAAARKAYKKAAGFARRLLALDPINQPARRRMIELHVSHARKQMRSKRADLAWKELCQAEEWERADSPSPLLRINQGLVGLHLDDREAAEARLREGVQLAGGGVPGWFRASLEAVLMKAGKAGAALLKRELLLAQEAPPAKDSIQALVPIIGSEAAREDRKAVAGLVLRIRGWLQKGSTLPWSAAEFPPVGEMFRQAGAYDVLADYTQQASRREPEEPIWRFYRIVARTKDDPDRLGFQDTELLLDMAALAAEREDFHGANRIRRFLEGTDGAPARPGRARRASEANGPSEDDVLDDLLTQSLEETPPEVVARLVSDLGRSKAVSEIVRRIRKSPLGDILPEVMLRKIAELMADSAAGSGRAPRF